MWIYFYSIHFCQVGHYAKLFGHNRDCNGSLRIRIKTPQAASDGSCARAGTQAGSYEKQAIAKKVAYPSTPHR